MVGTDNRRATAAPSTRSAK